MKKNLLITALWISCLNLSAQPVSCILKNGSTVFAGINNDLYKTTDNGNIWSKVVVAADVSDIKCLANAGSYIFIASNNGKIRLFKSNDGGNTWTVANNGLPTVAGFDLYSPIQMAVIKDTLFLGTTTAGVWKSSDFGQNWVATQQSGGVVNAVFAKGDTLVIGGGSIGRPKWSSNNGQTFTDFVNDLYNPGIPFNACVNIAYSNGRLFFTTTYAIQNVYTDDWGVTMNASSGALSPNTLGVGCSKVYTSSSDFGKFYVSTDNGLTFTEEMINGTSMAASVIYYDGTLMWLGTFASGIYNSPCTSTWTPRNNGLTLLNEPSSVNDNINIYPNPFNSKATIVIENNNIEIKNSNMLIYDILGNKVKQLKINGKSIEISRDHLSSGIYFYKIEDEKNNIIGMGKLIIE